jgi:hypothetical protein
MNLQNFCQRGGLAVLALGVAGYAGLATLRPAPGPAPAPMIAPPRVAAAAPPASPVIPLPVVAPAPEPPAGVSTPIATPVAMAVNMPVMPPAAAPPAPVQAVLVTTCPIAAAVPATPRPFRHVWEPRSHRWSRANILHAGARGERGRSITHAARADAEPQDRRWAVPYAARGWSDRRVD